MVFNTKDAAKYLGISVSYLHSLRYGNHNDSGPDFSMRAAPDPKGFVQRVCVYNKEDLDKWKESRKPLKKRRIWVSPDNSRLSLEPMRGWIEYRRQYE